MPKETKPKKSLKELLAKRVFDLFDKMPRGGIVDSELNKLVEEINQIK